MASDDYHHDADAEAAERQRAREQRYEDERKEVTADNEARRAELHWVGISVRDFQVEADARKAGEEELGGSDAVEEWLDNEEGEVKNEADEAFSRSVAREQRKGLGGGLQDGNVRQDQMSPRQMVVKKENQVPRKSGEVEHEVSRKRQRSEPAE